MKNLVRAMAFFRPDAARIALASGLLLLSTSASLIKPWPLAIIVDCLLNDKPMPAQLGGLVSGWDKATITALLALAILIAHAMQAALSTAHNYFLIQSGLSGLARVRVEVYRWLQRLSLRYHQGSTQGDILYRASWDTYAFHTLFQHGVFGFIGAIISLVPMLAIMLDLSWRLSLVVIATAPLLLIAVKGFGGKMNSRSLAAQEADSHVTTLFQQAMNAMALTQSHTREEREQSQFAQCCQRALGLRLSQHAWELWYLAAITVIFGMGVAGIAWLGARQVSAGVLTLGQLLVFLAYLSQIYEPLNQLSKVGATISSASAGVQRVFDVLDTPEEVKDTPNARPVHSAQDKAPAAESHLMRGSVTFDHVSFSYAPARPVLKNISFTLAAGESIAIVGPSGAGKTTLLHLLPRFFDPTEGVIRLDGVDLKDLRLKDLRRHVSLLMQEPILLPATIAENIAYGKPDASMDDIRNAAKSACADLFIGQLPQGYNTLVGEGAARLSVGEKQRINLARAFLKNAPILLLDEPTSALDSESESIVLNGLKLLMKNRTTLIIAHRLSTIQQAGKIMVLEEGRVTHFDSPSELLRLPGFFTRISTINT